MQEEDEKKREGRAAVQATQAAQARQARQAAGARYQDATWITDSEREQREQHDAEQELAAQQAAAQVRAPLATRKRSPCRGCHHVCHIVCGGCRNLGSSGYRIDRKFANIQDYFLGIAYRKFRGYVKHCPVVSHCDDFGCMPRGTNEALCHGTL